MYWKSCKQMCFLYLLHVQWTVLWKILLLSSRERERYSIEHRLEKYSRDRLEKYCVFLKILTNVPFQFFGGIWANDFTILFQFFVWKSRFRKKSCRCLQIIQTFDKKFNQQKYYHYVSFICAWAMPEAKKVYKRSTIWRRRLYFTNLSLLTIFYGIERWK